jgi:hypothetical protein
VAVRVEGLVRAYTRIQEQLRTGIAPSDAEPFRREVGAIIQQVEAICRRHRIAPDQLPAPSQRVYRFLKNLDCTALPLREPDTPPPPVGTLRISNLVATGSRLTERLWEERESLASASARRRLHATLVDHTLEVERLCARAGHTAAALPAPSRTVYCWLKFLAAGDNLALHLRALHRAHRAVTACAPPRELPVTVQLAYSSTLWRTRSRGADALLTVNEGFLSADEAIWTALIRHALCSGGAKTRHAVERFAASESFASVLFELASFATPQTAARGHVHDLDASFDRINVAYFNGRLVRPRLSWSKVPTARTFGHYQPMRDAVMVSVSLDTERVPEFVVDSVMHHELLHKQLGVTVSNGRPSVHGPAFRAAEQRYARHTEAEEFLNTLARSL